MSDFYDLFKRGEQPRQLVVVPAVEPGRASSYAAAALRSECEQVANAANGTRNDTLNRAFFNMGRHVGAGSIDLATVKGALYDAGRACGLPDVEIQTVLRDDATSAAHKGAESPRHATPQEPVPSVTILDAAGEPIVGLPPMVNPIIDWHELFATEDEGEEWIVEPLLPARRMIALYSAPKAGKSLLMLEVAVAIARGVPVLGATPDRARRVLYVDFENDPRGDVRARLEAMDLGPDQLDGLCYLTYPSLAKFDTAAGAADLLRHVEFYECEVVVIDTVSRAVMGEENENDTWLAFYRHTGLALKQAKVACIRLDHSGKDREKGMRGGSAKSGDVDAVWRLTLLNENTIQLECTDHRMPVPVKSLTLVRDNFPLAHRPLGDDWHLVADAKIKRVNDMLDALNVPSAASFRDAGKALRGAGEKVENVPLAAAVRLRKLRLDSPLMGVPGTPAEHRGTPAGSVPGTPPPKGASGTPAATVPEHPSDDPDELVSCTTCHGPTTRGVAGANDGLCATCSRTTEGDHA